MNQEFAMTIQNKKISNIFYVLSFLLIVSFLAMQVRADDDYDPKAIKFFEKGFAAMKKTKYEEAIKQFTKAIEVDPKFDKAYYDRALCYVRMNKFDESLPDYNKAIEVNPNYSVALVGRGRLLHHKKMIKEALADYNKAIELGTDDPVAYFNRGIIAQKGNTGDLGLADFKKTIETDPSYNQAYYNIACIYSVKNDLETDLKRKVLLIHIIWGFRDAAVLPTLSKALYDPSPLIWKEALNGLVTLGSEDCIKVMEAARTRPFKNERASIYFKEWLDEAIQQLPEGVLGEKISDGGLA